MNECCFTASLDNHFTDDFNRKLSIRNLLSVLQQKLKGCSIPCVINIKFVWFYLTIFVTQKLTEGAVDNFAEHDDLNQCDQFDMIHSNPTQIRVTILHEGT